MRRASLALLDWARELDGERVWALEDCRHVSGSFERFLLVSGERVVRVATKLMAGARRGARSRGKSDLIDALAVARAAMREGIESLPAAQLAGVELEISAARRSSRAARSPAGRAQQRPALEPARPLARAQARRQRAALKKWTSAKIARRLARAEQTARVRIARDELRRLRELTAAADALEAEIADLVAQAAPQLLAEPGFGPLDRREVDRRDRRRRPLLQRRKARPRRRRCTDPGQLRQDQPPPPRPRRQPPDSTPRSTESRSPAPAATPKRRTSSPANGPKERHQREAMRSLKRHLVRRIWQLLQPAPTDHWGFAQSHIS